MINFASDYLYMKAMNNETVVLKHLSIGYKNKQGVRTVASDISAVIRRGELTCLLGENGVGKSTLLRTLSVFQPKLDGTILLQDRPLESYSDRELARTVGVVLTEKPDVQQMTVYDLVAMGRSPYTGFWGRLDHTDREVIGEAISQVGIESLRHRQVTTLSDGERQKVMIAKALAQQTPVIYLDEPTAFLDYPSKVDMLLLLRRICRDAQKTVFLSTHDLELALQVADTVWLMSRKPDEESSEPSSEKSSEPSSEKRENNVSLHVGNPRELAAQGVLSTFVERSGGVRFDATTMSVKVL